MQSFLKFSVVAIFLLLLSGLVCVLFDPFHIYPARRDARRTNDVAEIMSLLETYISKNKNELPLNFPTELTQIGSDLNGCEVNTQHCHVTASSCANLHTALTGNPRLTLPSDIQSGNFRKTMFAIQLKDKKTVEVIACGTEGQQTISLTKTFPGVRTSTLSATLKK